MFNPAHCGKIDRRFALRASPLYKSHGGLIGGTALSPAELEELFVSLGVPVTGAEPPTDAVMPPMDELVRLFAGYGCEILGPPLSLSDLS